MRTYCRAQGTLLNALWLPKWEGNPRKRVYIFIYMRLIHFAVQQKLTQEQRQKSGCRASLRNYHV